MSFFNKILSDYTDDTLIGLNLELKALYINNNYIINNKSVLVLENSLYEATKMYNVLTNYTDKVYLFPMDDFLTSEALALSPELKTKRIETINNILNSDTCVVIVNLLGFLRFLPLPKLFLDKQILLKLNDTYNPENLVRELINYEYERTPIINKTGEIAVRGFVIDIFPINSINPVRIEFFDDEIESIKEFDIDSQLTIKKINQIKILPNTEFLCDIDVSERSQKNLPNYTKVTNIYEYMNKAQLVIDNYSQIKFAYEHLLDEIFSYNNSSNNKCDKYMFDLKEVIVDKYKNFEDFDNSSNALRSSNIHKLDQFTGNSDSINQRLNKYLKDKYIVVVCLNDRYKVNNVIESLNNNNIIFTDEYNIKMNKINIIIKKITYGFIIDKYVVVSEFELYNKRDIYSSYKTNFKLGTKIKDITKLNVGDYIVHVHNGIGIYKGIKSLVKNGLKKDYLTLEYAGGDKLYVPVEKIEFITKYSDTNGISPQISKLGSSEWIKTKLKVKKKIQDMAQDLLKLYSERESSKGFSFQKDTPEQAIFESEFKYTPTSDQLKVTEEIKRDMEKSVPMDRLLCGDVGFGKTEVAFRAMFKAIMSGKQVALLCPTTILSGQHYKNAIERFKSFPINIALLNRFVSTKDTNRILSELKEGKIDILIGTHRILSDDIVFKDLGLLVVDEEQRFGVRHKEKIKQYKTSIDVLTLSATPIPRTLQMSMTGIRNLSLIETAPVDRYPVQTYVLEEKDAIIKDAIYKELSRNGQIFILYNDVSDIENKVYHISRLVPDARVIYAHGQMNKDKLENIMIDFTNYKYDVLVCTTIIETGIDIPLVNTLIILNADRFGLSQLYQIRGRVGRSNKIAYAYLMYKSDKLLSEVANKRLSAIKDFTALGSGFSIAMRDLSIRGAGNIFGSEQSGFIDTIGAELFYKMLNEEVEKLKGHNIDDSEQSNKPLLDVATSIDNNYIKDDEIIIEIHKKINTIQTDEDLNRIKNEIIDRFGNVDDALVIYMYEELFESKASKLKISKVNQTNNFIEIFINKDIVEIIKTNELFKRVSDLSRMFRFSLKNDFLVITLDIIKLDKHFIFYLNDLLDILLDKSIYIS